MKKTLFPKISCLIALLVVAPVLWAACTAAPQSKAPYRIGFIDALSGSYAPIGVDQKIGEDMAIEEINNAGGINGHKLEPLSDDDQSSPPRSADLTRKLKDQGALAIIGGTGLPLGIAASEVAEREKIPFFGKSPVALPLQNGHPGSFTFGPPLPNFTIYQQLWLRLAVAAGGKRVAVILTNDPVGQSYDATNKQILKDNPGLFELVGTEYMLTTDTDVTPQLTKLKALKPDVLMVGPSGTPATAVYKGLDLLDWNIPAVSSSANCNLAFVQAVKGFSKRVLFTTSATALKPGTVPKDDPSRVDDLTKFQNKFQARTNKILIEGVLGAYESVFGFADVVSKLNLDPEKQSGDEMRLKIRDALESQSYQSLLLPIKRTPQDHGGSGSFRTYLARIDGDAIVPVSWMQFPGLATGSIK